MKILKVSSLVSGFHAVLRTLLKSPKMQASKIFCTFDLSSMGDLGGLGGRGAASEAAAAEAGQDAACSKFHSILANAASGSSSSKLRLSIPIKLFISSLI